MLPLNYYETQDVVFESSFLIGLVVEVHTRSVFNILDFVGTMGGVFGFIVVVFSIAIRSIP